MSEKLTSIEDVRRAASEMVQEASATQEARQTLINDFVNTFNMIPNEDFANSGITELLALDDSTFEMVAPVFLSELEKAFNNTNDKVSLVQILNASGTRVEDLANQYESMLELLNEPSETSLSQPKIDFLKELIGIIYNMVADTEGVPHRIIRIPIEICNPNAKYPAYAHVSDAGMDVYALEDITIAPGEVKLIPIGVKVALPRGYELQVRPKSGRALKTKLRIANAPGTIDSGYRDEIKIIVENVAAPIQSITFGKTFKVDNMVTGYNPDYFGPDSITYGPSYTIGAGEKFAQLVLSEVVTAAWYDVKSVSSIGDDREGGFGSTGLL